MFIRVRYRSLSRLVFSRRLREALTSRSRPPTAPTPALGFGTVSPSCAPMYFQNPTHRRCIWACVCVCLSFSFLLSRNVEFWPRLNLAEVEDSEETRNGFLLSDRRFEQQPTWQVEPSPAGSPFPPSSRSMLPLSSSPLAISRPVRTFSAAPLARRSSLRQTATRECRRAVIDLYGERRGKEREGDDPAAEERGDPLWGGYCEGRNVCRHSSPGGARRHEYTSGRDDGARWPKDFGRRRHNRSRQRESSFASLLGPARSVSFLYPLQAKTFGTLVDSSVRTDRKKLRPARSAPVSSLRHLRNIISRLSTDSPRAPTNCRILIYGAVANASNARDRTGSDAPTASARSGARTETV